MPNSETAGVDLSTGHAVDSFFNDGTHDPWAEHCVVALVDLLVNYDQLLFAYPSKDAIEKIGSKYLPHCILALKAENILEKKDDLAADEISLPRDQIDAQFEVFTNWAVANRDRVHQWLSFAQSGLRIMPSQEVDIGANLDRSIKEAWPNLKHARSAQITGLGADRLQYTFHRFLRAVQYHKVFGYGAHYYAHPIREAAFSPGPSSPEGIPRLSWGRYFLAHLKSIDRDNSKFSLDWLLEKAVRVREKSRDYGVTWFGSPNEDPDEAAKAIASEVGLPAKLPPNLVKAVAVVAQTTPAALYSYPVVAFSLTAFFALVFTNWHGEVPGKLGQIGALRAHLKWEGLTS